MKQSEAIERKRMVTHLQSTIAKHREKINDLEKLVGNLTLEMQEQCPHDWAPDKYENQLDGWDYHLKCTICNKKVAT